MTPVQAYTSCLRLVYNTLQTHVASHQIELILMQRDTT